MPPQSVNVVTYRSFLFKSHTGPRRSGVGGDWRPGRSASSGRRHRNGRTEVEDRREAPVAAARGGPKEEHGPTRLSGSGTNSAAPPWRRIHVEVLGPLCAIRSSPAGLERTAARHRRARSRVSARRRTSGYSTRAANRDSLHRSSRSHRAAVVERAIEESQTGFAIPRQHRDQTALRQCRVAKHFARSGHAPVAS